MVSQETTGTSRLRISHEFPTVITVVLEPWGAEYTLVRGTTVEILAEGAHGIAIECSFVAPNILMVYPHPTGVLKLFVEGREVDF